MAFGGGVAGVSVVLLAALRVRVLAASSRNGVGTVPVRGGSVLCRTCCWFLRPVPSRGREEDLVKASRRRKKARARRRAARSAPTRRVGRRLDTAGGGPRVRSADPSEPCGPAVDAGAAAAVVSSVSVTPLSAAPAPAGAVADADAAVVPSASGAPSPVVGPDSSGPGDPVASVGAREDAPADADELSDGVDARLRPAPEVVWLRPVVRGALDAEAERLGCSRNDLCRFLLEEVARALSEAGAGGAPAVESEDAAGARSFPGAAAGAEIPPAYVGGGESDAPAERPEPAGPAGSAVGSLGAPLRSGGAGSGVQSAVDRRSAAPGRRRGRRLGAPLVVAAVGLAVLWGAARFARYEMQEAAGAGVYVFDRWTGGLWGCSVPPGGSRPPACRAAVFGPAPGMPVRRFAGAD